MRQTRNVIKDTSSGTNRRNTQTKMAEQQSSQEAGERQAKGAPPKPGWAKGLRQLYDSVVDEPLPNDFQDLLDKLDKDD